MNKIQEEDAVERFREASLAFCGLMGVSNTTRRKLGATIRRLKKLSTDQSNSEIAAELQRIALVLKETNEAVHRRACDSQILAHELREALTRRASRFNSPPQLRLVQGGRS